jgi:hypothetical protein
MMLFLGGAALLFAGQGTVREILSLPQGEISVQRWLEQNSWEEQRGTVDLFSIKDGTLYMQSESTSTTIGTRFRSKIRPLSNPWIEFRYRVDKLPEGTDVTDKTRDDAALRVFVLFDKGGIFGVTPPHTIGYVWDTTLEKGATGRSESFGQVRYIVIGSGEEGLGEWQTCRRNMREDYRLLFETEKVPYIKALGVKCDSNHSHSSAASAIQWIRFSSDR